MTDDNHEKNERNAAFKKYIEVNKEVIQAHSDSQPKTIKPDDEWAEEHEWTKMYREINKK